ncbi:DUF6527 family protein [Roseivivax isoporae]|nr:DUF6527 family protein [Roseivivax isoporae]
MSAVGSKLRRLADNIVAFRCPGCRTMHQVWTDRWRWNGDGDAPTFSPSVLVTYDGADVGQGGAPQARCHSFVENGRIRFLPDCTHELAGETVPLPTLLGGT